eukprot:772526-Pleurochrysis_carterae.AAC.2
MPSRSERVVDVQSVAQSQALLPGPLAPTTLSKQLRTLCPKELRPLEAVTKGYGLTQDTSHKQAASLGRITEVRVPSPLVSHPPQ